MYEVIVYFEDLQDGGHPYNIGDAYPRKGLEVSEDRIRELSTSNNARRKPLICATSHKAEEVPEPVEETETAEEAAETPVEAPVEVPEPVEEPEKPKRGTKNGQSSNTKAPKRGLGKKK